MGKRKIIQVYNDFLVTYITEDGYCPSHCVLDKKKDIIENFSMKSWWCRIIIILYMITAIIILKLLYKFNKYIVMVTVHIFLSFSSMSRMGYEACRLSFLVIQWYCVFESDSALLWHMSDMIDFFLHLVPVLFPVTLASNNLPTLLVLHPLVPWIHPGNNYHT